MSDTAKTVRLAPLTLVAFEDHIRQAELTMESCLTENQPFLWSALKPELSKRIRDGHVVAELWSGSGPLHITDGLIHDWIGAAFVPAAPLTPHSRWCRTTTITRLSTSRKS